MVSSCVAARAWLTISALSDFCPLQTIFPLFKAKRRKPDRYFSFQHVLVTNTCPARSQFLEWAHQQYLEFWKFLLASFTGDAELQVSSLFIIEVPGLACCSSLLTTTTDYRVAYCHGACERGGGRFGPVSFPKLVFRAHFGLSSLRLIR